MSESSGDNGIEIEIVNTGKNSRRIVSKLSVRGSLQTVWDILTDYEGLAGFIPSLAVSRLLEKRDGFARVFQIGEQDLALGLKVNAKCTIDCFERDLQAVTNGLKRDIEFKMVEGDFQVFEGKWSVEQKIPPAFINKSLEGRTVAEVVSLKDKYGNIWRVKVQKVDSDLYFTEGWTKLVRDNSIMRGNPLLFEYVSEDLFTFKVMGPSGVEKRGVGSFIPPSQ